MGYPAEPMMTIYSQADALVPQVSHLGPERAYDIVLGQLKTSRFTADIVSQIALEVKARLERKLPN